MCYCLSVFDIVFNSTSSFHLHAAVSFRKYSPLHCAAHWIVSLPLGMLLLLLATARYYRFEEPSVLSATRLSERTEFIESNELSESTEFIESNELSESTEFIESNELSVRH